MWISWFIRILIIFLIVRVLRWFWSSMIKGTVGQRRVPLKRSATLVRDPVCGTFVDQSLALSTKYAGVVHYFCSERCRLKYGQQVPYKN